MFVGLYILIGVVVILFFTWVYFDSCCPKCRKAFMKKLENKIKLGEKTVYRDENQRTNHQDKHGQTIYVKMRVPFIQTEYESHWKCEACGHEWIAHSSEEKRA